MKLKNKEGRTIVKTKDFSSNIFKTSSDVAVVVHIVKISIFGCYSTSVNHYIQYFSLFTMVFYNHHNRIIKYVCFVTPSNYLLYVRILENQVMKQRFLEEFDLEATGLDPSIPGQ